MPVEDNEDNARDMYTRSFPYLKHLKIESAETQGAPAGGPSGPLSGSTYANGHDVWATKSVIADPRPGKAQKQFHFVNIGHVAS